MVWIFASILVFSTSLLIRVLVITRLQKRAVAPPWLTLALAGVTILAATCLLAAALPANMAGERCLHEFLI